MNEQDFNKQYPVGSPVVYYPIASEPEFEETTTRSEAWTLGSGHVVVKIVGHAGGVSVDHIKPANNASSGRGGTSPEIDPVIKAVNGMLDACVQPPRR